MKFDKNAFKENFRLWCVKNMDASLDEAEVFCSEYVPNSNKFVWLKEECVGWFSWLKEKNQEQQYLTSSRDDLS